MTLLEGIEALRRGATLFIATVAVCVAGSVALALVLPPVYRSEVVVAPVAEDSSGSALSGLASQFGGLASAAGLSVGKGQGWEASVAVLRSRHIVEKLINDRTLLPVLFADRWDSESAKWRRDVKVPTLGDGVLLFQRRVLQVRDDAKTGLVTVRVEWKEPQLASEWANYIVALADGELRGNAVGNAVASMNVLQAELQHAEGIELRAAIARVFETQLKAKMIAGVRREYAFRVIDPAVPADRDKRVQPTRTVIVITGTLFGLILGSFIVLIRENWRRRVVNGEPVGADLGR